MRAAIAHMPLRSSYALALEASRCGAVVLGRAREGANTGACLTRVAQCQGLTTFLVMIPKCTVVQVVHSLFLYQGPLDRWGEEPKGTMFGFLGERVQGHTPALVRMLAGLTAS